VAVEPGVRRDVAFRVPRDVPRAPARNGLVVNLILCYACHGFLTPAQAASGPVGVTSTVRGHFRLRGEPLSPLLVAEVIHQRESPEFVALDRNQPMSEYLARILEPVVERDYRALAKKFGEEAK